MTLGLMLTAVGFVLTAFSLAGNLGVMRHQVWGWWVWLLTDAGWVAQCVVTQDWGQAPLWLMYVAINIAGIVQWSRQPREKEQTHEHQHG